MMLTGNKNADLYEILMIFDDESLLNFCKSAVNQEYEKSLCRDEKFWESRFYKKYPLLIKFKENQTYKKFYLEMVYYISKLEEEFGIPYISSKEFDPKRFYKIYRNDENIYNEAMIEAAKEGHADIVKLMINKGANHFNNTMREAARKGHTDIVKLMIEKGATEFNGAMEAASAGGHMDIVKLMIEKGAYNFNGAVYFAIAKGHMDIVKLLIQKGAKIFNEYIYMAIRYRNMDMLKLLLKNTKLEINEINRAMITAAQEGELSIVKLMVEKGATDFYKAIEAAEKRRNMNIIEYLKIKINKNKLKF